MGNQTWNLRRNTSQLLSVTQSEIHLRTHLDQPSIFLLSFQLLLPSFSVVILKITIFSKTKSHLQLLEHPCFLDATPLVKTQILPWPLWSSALKKFMGGELGTQWNALPVIAKAAAKVT